MPEENETEYEEAFFIHIKQVNNGYLVDANFDKYIAVTKSDVEKIVAKIMKDWVGNDKRKNND